jgi:hypothetical protein
MFITFIELVMEGDWEEMTIGEDIAGEVEIDFDFSSGRIYQAGEDSSLSIVEPEIIIRRFSFARNAKVSVTNSVASFNKEHVTAELTVDDADRTSGGKRLKVT